MEITISLLLMSSLCTAFTAVILWILERRKAQKFLASYGIPGPTPSLIMGNFMLFLNDNVGGWTKIIEQHGDICSFYVGRRPMILVANLETIRRICVTESSKFRNRPDFVMGRIVPLADGLLALRDDRWKISRQTLSPTFSASKMKWMVALMDEPIGTFVAKLSEFADQRSMFDVYHHAQALTLEVIGRCAFGIDVNCQKDLDDPFFKAVSHLMKHTRNTMVHLGLLFPGLEDVALFLNKHLMPTGYQVRESMKRLKRVIGRRRRTNSSKPIKDLLQLMLNASSEGDDNRKLSDEEVIGNAFSFVLAGFETTATAIAFTMYLVAKHPEYQEKLYRHVMEEAPEKVDYDDVMFGLPFLDQIVNESLRYYPPVPVFTNRECAESCEIQGQVFPKGSGIMVPVYHIHHNETHWPDPEVFDPSRFAPENKPGIVPQSFMPFGVGQRNCIGMRFALLETKLTIVEAIKKFKFQFCDKTEDPLTLGIPLATLFASNGIYLSVTKRSNC